MSRLRRCRRFRRRWQACFAQGCAFGQVVRQCGMMRLGRCCHRQPCLRRSVPGHRRQSQAQPHTAFRHSSASAAVDRQRTHYHDPGHGAAHQLSKNTGLFNCADVGLVFENGDLNERQGGSCGFYGHSVGFLSPKSSARWFGPGVEVSSIAKMGNEVVLCFEECSVLQGNPFRIAS